MNITQIIGGLERSDTTGAEADRMARLGFLEWAVSMDGQATPQAAHAALSDPAARNASSAAARAFVGFLEQATWCVEARAARRARRSLPLH